MDPPLHAQLRRQDTQCADSGRRDQAILQRGREEAQRSVNTLKGVKKFNERI